MTPLNGLRVIELAGPAAALAGRRLADIGAEVIKIEPPSGDDSRRYDPFLSDATGNQRSLWFEYNHQGERSLKLDLAYPEQRVVLQQLAAGADVLLETFAPGYLAGLGLGYETLSADNAGLIHVTVTGFGQTRPWRDYRANDFIAAASGGQMSICGLPDRPLKPYGQQCYQLASYFAAIGVMLALRERERSGRGQFIDISLQEVTAAALDHLLPRLTTDPADVPRRQGGRHWNGAFILTPCRDGLILISPLFGRETLAELIRADGLPCDLDAEKWGEPDYLRRNIAVAEAQVCAYSARHNADELMVLGQAMRLPWAVVADLDDVTRSPQLTARGFFVKLPDEGLVSPGLPVRFSEIEYTPRRAPLPGEEDRRLPEVLCDWQPRENTAGAYSETAVLDGIRVLDFSRVLAGPYATRLLADYGAEVIQVTSRQVPGALEVVRDSYYQTWNRNKKSIRLNLSRSEGRDLARRLAARCDVVLENFTPRVLANWEMDYSRLAEIKPGIILVSLSGFGQTGPWRDYAAFGPTIEALSGLTALTAFEDSVPLGAGFALSDHLSGLAAVWATLAALAHRDQTGQGQHVDISEYEVMVAALGPELMARLNGGDLSVPVGNQPEYQPDALNLCYRAADGRWCALSIETDEDWANLCALLKNQQWMQQPGFGDAFSRRAHAADIERDLESWTQQYPADESARRFQAVGLAAAAVSDGQELRVDPQLMARGFFASVNHPAFGKVNVDRPPLLFSRTKSLPYCLAPAPGADNDYVYGELLGLTPREIRRYIEEEVIY